MAITYYQANRILDNNFGRVTNTPATTLYIGLSTTPINQDGSGVTEPTGGGYVRISVQNNKTTFSTSANGQLYNLIQVEFPEATSAWGTITHIFISDAQSGGNILYYDALSVPRQVQIASTLLFAPQAIKIQMVNTAVV